MKIVILEDEPATLRQIKSFISDYSPAFEVVKTAASVKEAVSWFSKEATGYDLIFMDIRLSDGLSFEIFDHVKINSPVIFLTAYDNYALEAFQTNGIAYLLKPLDPDQLAKAFEKHKLLTGNQKEAQVEIGRIINEYLEKKTYRKSLLIHHRDRLIPLSVQDISWINSENELTHLKTQSGQTYNLDQTLDGLMDELDPAQFYRANRQFIINKSAVKEVHFYFNGRLSLDLISPPDDRILISKAKSGEFKSWMNK